MQIHSKLINACKKKDAKAQMQLYDLYVKAMYNIALKYVQKTDVAEDVVQEAFLKAFKKIEMFDAQVTFGAWLKRIVINQSIDYLKKRKIEVISIDAKVINLSSEPIQWELNKTISVNEIIKKINELPTKYKTVLQLFLLEGYDHQEISEILKISNVASRTQLLRGKNKLKKLLNNYNYAKGY